MFIELTGRTIKRLNFRAVLSKGQFLYFLCWSVNKLFLFILTAKYCPHLQEKKSNSMVTYRKEDSDVSHLKLYDHSPENKPLLVHKEDNSEQTKDTRIPLQSFGWVIHSFSFQKKNNTKAINLINNQSFVSVRA